MRWKPVLKIFISAAGIYLMARLMLSFGWSQIADAFRAHIAGLIFMICIYGLYHFLRTWTLRICTPFPISMKELFGIRLAGEAIAYLALGTILGDAVKVTLARKKIPLVPSATGVFAEKLIYHLAGAGFILGGLFVAVIRLGANDLLLYSMAVVLIFFVTMLFLVSSSIRPLAHLLSRFPVRRPRLREAILSTEARLFQFRKEHPRETALALLFDFASYFYSCLETMFVLYLLGVHSSLWQLWYYQSMVKLASSAAVVMPANLGVFEGINVLLAKQLQFGGGIGILVALFIRLRAIVWAVIGYLWFLYLMADHHKNETSK